MILNWFLKRIQNSVKTSKVAFFATTANKFQLLTIFTEKPVLIGTISDFIQSTAGVN